MAAVLNQVPPRFFQILATVDRRVGCAVQRHDLGRQRALLAYQRPSLLRQVALKGGNDGHAGTRRFCCVSSYVLATLSGKLWGGVKRDEWWVS
jgi:hypothetical protein